MNSSPQEPHIARLSFSHDRRIETSQTCLHNKLVTDRCCNPSMPADYSWSLGFPPSPFRQKRRTAQCRTLSAWMASTNAVWLVSEASDARTPHQNTFTRLMPGLGERWGSCYDTCTQLPPRPPRCSHSDAATTTKCSSTVMSQGDSCPTVCAGVDDCGVPFSTCFPRCSTSLWPNKSCNTTTPTRTPSSSSCTASDSGSIVVPPSLNTSSLITSSNFNACSTQTICADFIKTCEGLTTTSTLAYGG